MEKDKGDCVLQMNGVSNNVVVIGTDLTVNDLEEGDILIGNSKTSLLFHADGQVKLNSILKGVDIEIYRHLRTMISVLLRVWRVIEPSDLFAKLERLFSPNSNTPILSVSPWKDQEIEGSPSNDSKFGGLQILPPTCIGSISIGPGSMALIRESHEIVFRNNEGVVVKIIPGENKTNLIDELRLLFNIQ